MRLSPEHRRLLPVIILICVGSLLSGCRRTSSARLQLLERAEAIVEENPDSALTLLSALPDAATLSPSEGALRGLVLTRALDKTYCLTDNDSVIAWSYDYYCDSKDVDRRMMSAFYYGRVRTLGADYPEAMNLFTEALDIASRRDDEFWVARSATELAEIYEVTNHFKEAHYYSGIALDNFRKSGSQPYLNYAYLGYALSCLNLPGNDSIQVAYGIANQMLDSADVYADAYLRQYAMLALSKISYWKRDWANTIKYSAPVVASGFAESDVTGQLGIAYLASGQKEMAKTLLPDTVDMQDVVQLTFAYQFAKSEGDDKRALYYNEHLLSLNDSILSASLAQNMAQTLVMRHQMESKEKELEIQRGKLRQVIILAVAVVVLIIVGTSLAQYVRRNKREINGYIEFAESLRRSLRLKELQLGESNQKVKTLFEGRFTDIEKLISKYHATLTNPVVKRQLSAQIDQIIKDYSANDKKLRELQSLLDSVHDGVYSDFAKDFPDLTREEYLMFLYCGLGFSTTTMMVLLDVEKPGVIYTRKSRLKDKISKSDSPRVSDYLKLL